MVKTLTDKTLINKIKNKDCNDSLIILTERHQGIVHRIYERYKAALLSFGFTYEDFATEKYLLVYSAAKDFNFNAKTKFSSYLANCTRFFCLKKLQKDKHNEEKKNKFTDYYFIKTSVLPQEKSNNDDYDIILEKTVEAVEECCDNKFSQIFELRHLTEEKVMGWSRIGDQVGLSGQQCINIYNKNIPKVREKLKEVDTLQDTEYNVL